MTQTRTRSDRYPSRVGAEASITPRVEPVVHPGGPVSVLSDEQLAGFEREGFLLLESVFDGEEMARCRAELTAMAARAEVRSTPQAVVEPTSQDVRSIFEVHRSSAVFSELARDHRVADVARTLVGSDVYLHQSRVNLKPGLRGKEFFWHSDFETWHVEDGMPAMRAVSASVALTDNTEFNGPLMIIPGSHRSYVACGGETPERHYEQSLKRQEHGVPDAGSLTRLVEEGGIAAPKGAAGSVVFFDCNAMHASGVNLSPYPRSNVFLVYNSVENTLEAPYSGQPPRPEYLGSRDFTPLG
jgi:ectoine hydroxylase